VDCASKITLVVDIGPVQVNVYPWTKTSLYAS